MLLMRADFLGLIDFVKTLVEFDGTLIDSKAFEVFVLTGDSAFRSKLRDDGYVLLTLGGFHPSDKVPSQIILPELTQVVLTLTPGFFFGLVAGPLNTSGILGVDI